MNKYFLLLLLLNSIARADVCDSLSTLSCAPGSFADKTGTVPSESELKKSRDEQEAQIRNFYKNEFTNALNAPDSDYFREISKNALGLSDFPSCTSRASADISTCNNNIVEGLTQLAANQTLHTTEQRYGGDLSAIQDLSHNAAFQDIIDRSEALADSNFAKNPLISKIKNDIFPQIKNQLAAKINTLPISAEQKRIMISKVKSIRFAGTDCEDLGSHKIANMFVPNASYYGKENTFKYCKGLLDTSSEFSLAFIISHELAHSIDPCSLPTGLTAGNLFATPKGSSSNDTVTDIDNKSILPKLLECLRDPQSVGALNIPDQPPTPAPGDNGNDVYSPGPKSLCRDQIGESFADWMATELTPDFIKSRHPNLTKDDYITGYANALRPICTSFEGQMQKDTSIDVHPPTIDRIDKILLANPKVRANMGCPKEHKNNIYCTANGPITPATGSGTLDESNERAQ